MKAVVLILLGCLVAMGVLAFSDPSDPTVHRPDEPKAGTGNRRPSAPTVSDKSKLDAPANGARPAKGSKGSPTTNSEGPLTPQTLIGVWKLVSVDNESPDDAYWWHDRHVYIEFKPDGTFRSFSPPYDTNDRAEWVTSTHDGVWSLTGQTLSYTSGSWAIYSHPREEWRYIPKDRSGQTTVRLESGRLIMDPDILYVVSSEETFVSGYARTEWHF